MIKSLEFRATIPPIMSAIRTGGDGMRVCFDVPECDVQDAIALVALRNVALKITVEVDTSANGKPQPEEKPAKPKKEAKSKGEFSAYWSRMFAAGFNASRDLWEALRVETMPEVKDRLHEVFGVESLTFVSPAQFEEWAAGQHLESLVSMSRQATVKAEAAR